MHVSRILVIALAVVFGTASLAPGYAKGPSATGQQHSNKGGALRGLNRANQVAGVHGQAGRANAAAHHQ